MWVPARRPGRQEIESARATRRANHSPWLGLQLWRVKSLREKYSDFQKRQIRLYSSASRSIRRGVSRTSRTWGWAVVGRGGARDGRCQSGRPSRVVLISLKLVSSLRSFPQATVAQLSPGRPRSNSINHCAGMPGGSGVTVAHYLRNFCRGRIGARYPRAL